MDADYQYVFLSVSIVEVTTPNALIYVCVHHTFYCRNH